MSNNASSSAFLVPPSSLLCEALTLIENISERFSQERYDEVTLQMLVRLSQVIRQHLVDNGIDLNDRAVALIVEGILTLADEDYIDDEEADDFAAGGEKKGAPPAAKSAIEKLETFEVYNLGSSSSSSYDDEVCCAVCKETMVKGEIGKKLPCGHCYHEDCIVTWLGIRNSCPLCRFQLQTDDVEYEEKKRSQTIY